MQSLAYIQGSNGSANPSLMTVQTLRSPGATSILVNTVAGAPTKFYGTMGAPHTFTDPVTGETITVISEATAVDFAGTVTSGHVDIVAIAPGYSDTRGSLVGDIIVVRPVTEWANNIFNVLSQSHNDDGTIKNGSITADAQFATPVSPVTRALEMLQDFVVPGGAVLAGLGYGSTLTASLSAGICYIGGNRQIIAAVATRTYTASKDTYVDALYNASGTVTIVYTEVANNAASPVLAANSIRLGIVVSGANIAAVGSINQGQDTKVLPISAGFPYAINDSLGNRICRRDPYETRRSFGSVIPGVPVIPNSYQTYISLPFISQGRSIEIEYGCNIKDGASGAARTGHYRIQIDGASAGDIIWQTNASGVYASAGSHIIPVDVAAGLHTITMQVEADTAAASLLQSAFCRVVEP